MKTDAPLQQEVFAEKWTDADIAHTAQNLLQWWTYLPTDAVKVKVDNGWVILSGEVEWDYQRREATDAVRHLMGIMGVREQIAIKPKASPGPVHCATSWTISPSPIDLDAVPMNASI